MRKHIELAAERNLKFKNHLLDTQEFLQLVDQHQNVISLDPLTSTWIRCSRRKRRHPPWEETALNIGKETTLCSVSERTLAFWKEQDVHTIRSFFAPAATAKLQFKSKKAFFEKLHEILDTNLLSLTVRRISFATFLPLLGPKMSLLATSAGFPLISLSILIRFIDAASAW